MKYPQPMPKWVGIALSLVGIAEIVGKQHNPKIINWLITLKAWWKDDETAWCGTFVAHCLKEAGLVPPKNWFRAKEYGGYGEGCSKSDIPFGAICVKSRKGGGHVFFAVAKSSNGQTIYGLGGNQGNKVSIVPFALSDIDAVRWPGFTQTKTDLPIASSSAEVGAAKPGSEA